MGGAWHCAAMLRTKGFELWKSAEAGITTSTTRETDTPCTDEVGTKGACNVNMVLQQSWPWWPCDEHGIELQHFIACSGVVVGSQSNAYAPRAHASIARRNGLAKHIIC